ncbi:MAG: transposase, partial [Nitrospinae bacterium]|nr:transposase [Nitrospinota bacterium]
MRRYQAIALVESGKSHRCVAATLRASLSSVVRWAQSYRQQGLPGLQPQPTPGRPPRLSPAHKAKLERILLRGPLKVGYATDLWTLKRVAQVIELHFGVRYHPCHIWRLLVGMGWSCQKPE